jgi:hypothetical protein
MVAEVCESAANARLGGAGSSNVASTSAQHACFEMSVPQAQPARLPASRPKPSGSTQIRNGLILQRSIASARDCPERSAGR